MAKKNKDEKGLPADLSGAVSLTDLMRDGKIPKRLKFSEGVYFGYFTLDELRPNSWNPNEMQEDVYGFLVHEIERAGFRDPITVLPDGTIVDGEHRLNALRDNGYSDTWAIIVPDDVEEAKLATVNMNMIKGEANPLKLGNLLAAQLARGLSLEELSSRVVIKLGEIQALTALTTDMSTLSPEDIGNRQPRGDDGKLTISFKFEDEAAYHKASLAVKEYESTHKKKGLNVLQRLLIDAGVLEI